MGKQVSTLKMTGSFAGAVGYIDKQGRVQMRSKAEKINDANTKKQREVRTGFLAISTLAKGFKRSLVGLSHAAGQHKISLRNEFMKQNYKAAQVEWADNTAMAETMWAELMVAVGDVPSVSFGSIDVTDPLTVKVPFTGNSDMPGTDDSDLIRIVVYNPVDNIAIMSQGVRRASNEVYVTVPNSWNGETVHVYGFVQHFETQDDAIYYESIFNDPTKRGGEAESAQRYIESQAEYSNSRYLGSASIN